MVICKIVTCFDEQYGALFCDIDNPSAENIRREMIEGDSMLSNICKVYNTKVWPDNELLVHEDDLQKQLESRSFMYQHYHAMLIFVNCNVEDIKSGFLSLGKYAATSNGTIYSLKNIFEISNNADKYLWKKALLLIEIAFMCPTIKCSTRKTF